MKQVYIDEANASDFEKMKQIFGRFRYEVIQAVVKSLSDTGKLKEYLWECCEDIREKLTNTATVKEMMQAVTDNITIINIELLKSVVDFFDIPEAKKLVEEYNSKLDNFCTNTLFAEILNEEFTELTFSESQKIEFILDWNPGTCRLQSIFLLLKKAFQKKSKRVYFKFAYPTQSIAIVCFAPLHVIDDLMMQAQDNMSVLLEQGLIRLTIGQECIYDKASDVNKVNKVCILFVSMVLYKYM